MTSFYKLLSSSVLLFAIIFSSTEKLLAGGYSSSAATQSNTAGVAPGATNQDILRVAVSASAGGGTNCQITSMSFTMQNTNNADVASAKLYYTTTTTFSTATMLGTAVANPTGTITFSFTSAAFSNTTVYFWLAFDIAAGATACTNTVDALVAANGITAIGGNPGNFTPTTPDPTGNRQITGVGCWDYCNPNTLNCGLNDIITNVTMNTLNNTSSGCPTNGYIFYTGSATSIQQSLSYNLSITSGTGSGTHGAGVWIDFNNNGSFADAGEFTLISNSIAASSTATTTIAVPAGAVLGLTRMRVRYIYATTVTSAMYCTSGTYGETEDYEVTIDPAPTPMVFVSSTTTQTNTSSVNAGTFKQEIVGVQIVMDGSVSPLSATSFTFNTAGTTSAANDIQNAQLWYTSTNAAFATTAQVGSTIASPSGAFTFAISQALLDGTNYFWLTYDIKTTAPGGDVVDATCTSVTVGGTPRTPSVTAPAGNRPIIAALPMSYVSSTVTQTSSRSPRPDVNQLVIGIEIVTTGALSPLSATSFSLTTTGTTTPLTTIQNARLWSTGSSSSFATTTQVGATVAAPNGAFTITPAVTLINGTNYFWLTYDVQAGAGCDPTQFDGQCTSITVGGTPRTPTVTAPLGSIVIDCNTAFYSKGSLPPNLLTSWSSTRNGAGASPGSFAATSSFYVQNGHTMTTTGTATIPYMIVEGGGYIRATSLISMTDLRINSYGTYEQAVTAANGSYITNFYIENYGTWIHNNPGFLPSGGRYFSPNSNQWFYQWGGGTFPSGTSWGNVLLNGSTTGNFGMGNCLTTIQGDFEWRRIGTNNYLMDEQDETINIGGDLIFSGGWWKILTDNGFPFAGAANVTINVAGDFIMTAGTLEDYFKGTNTSSAILNVNGNVSITGGTLNLNLSPGGLSQMNLTVGTPSVTWTQTGGTVTLCNTNIKSGKTVTLVGNKMGDVAASRTITAETGSTLMCDVYPVTGAGTFTLADNATLGIGNTAGINSTLGSATGNIQTTTARNYHSGGNYIYYKGSNQITGVFTTAPTALTVRNLTINKNLAAERVDMSQNLSVTSVTTLTLGELNLNSRTLTALSSATGAITGGAAGVSYIKSETSSAVNPSIVQWNIGATNGTYVVPFGVSSAASDYIPFTFAKTAGSSNMQFSTRNTGSNNTPWAGSSNVAAVAHMNDPTLVLTDGSIPAVVDRWWDITALAGSTSVTANLTFTYRGPENTLQTTPTNLQTGTLAAQHWNGTGWDSPVGTGAGVTSGTGTVTVSGANTFSPWVVSALGAPLPIKLVDFSASCNGKGIDLKWTTASEENNDYFIVEKSYDGKEFRQIKRVDGAGNSNRILNYEASDREPVNSLTYYRLLQFDYNGNYSYSDLITAEKCKGAGPVVNSWLTDNDLNVEIKSEVSITYEVVLHDVTGRRIYHVKKETEPGINKVNINVDELGSGVYFLSVYNNETAVTSKINLTR